MCAARAEIVSETIEHPNFGQLHTYRPTAAAKGAVLFLTDADGWNAELTTVARTIADLDYSVVGINLPSYFTRLSTGNRVDAAALSEFKVPARMPPILCKPYLWRSGR